MPLVEKFLGEKVMQQIHQGSKNLRNGHQFHLEQQTEKTTKRKDNNTLQVLYENMQEMHPRLVRATYYNPHPNLIPLVPFTGNDETLGTGGNDSAFYDNISVSQWSPEFRHIYTEGIKLKDYISENGAITDKNQTLMLMAQLCSAVDHLHANGIVHRDISTANVIINENANAYLYDYETAGLIGENDKIWQVGIGTEEFAAPEQFPRFTLNISRKENKKAQLLNSEIIKQRGTNLEFVRGRPQPTPATDTYALAVLFTKMHLGDAPGLEYSYLDTNNTYYNSSFSNRIRPRLDITPSVKNVILKATETDYRKRYQSGEELFTAFYEALSEEI